MQIYSIKEVKKSLHKVGGFKVVLNNPSFYTPLEEDD